VQKKEDTFFFHFQVDQHLFEKINCNYANVTSATFGQFNEIFQM